VNGAAYSLVITQYVSLFTLLSIYKPRYSWPAFLNALNPQNFLNAIRYTLAKE
jgi:hypothetical protein